MTRSDVVRTIVPIYSGSGKYLAVATNFAIDTKEVVVVINTHGVKAFGTSYTSTRNARVPFVYKG